MKKTKYCICNNQDIKETKPSKPSKIMSFWMKNQHVIKARGYFKTVKKSKEKNPKKKERLVKGKISDLNKMYSLNTQAQSFENYFKVIRLI